MRFNPLKVLVLGMVVVQTPAMAWEMTLLHTNDTHSRIEPVNSRGNDCTDKDIQEKACLGGAARVATLVKKIRSERPGAVALVSAGDEFQGSLYYTTYKGMASAKIMNLLGYQAMALGNHEFDDGSANLARFISGVDFPVLSSNLTVDPSNPLFNKYSPYRIMTINGEKIGFVGVTTLDSVHQITTEAGLVFKDTIQSTQQAVTELEAQGISKIVVLSHCGLKEDLKLAEAIPSIDIIVSGHSHTLLSNTSKKSEGAYPQVLKMGDDSTTLIVSDGEWSQHLGRLDVEFDQKGRITRWSGDTLPITMDISADADVLAAIEPLKLGFSELKKQIVTQAPFPLLGVRELSRHQECDLGSIAADAALWATRTYGTEIGFFNGGAIVRSLDPGPVTVADMIQVYPYANTISSFEIKGELIKEILENGVSKAEDAKNKGTGRFLHVSNLQYSWDGTKPVGSRIQNLFFIDAKNGNQRVSIDPGRVYKVAAPSYIVSGGDEFSVIKKNATRVVDTGLVEADAIAKYLAQSSTIVPPTDPQKYPGGYRIKREK